MTPLSTSQANEANGLRRMWQFPATCKLLEILCQPLHLTPPTSGQLEAALVSPKDHINLIANLHGRLLGLGLGSSSLNKWLQVTGRFVRKHADEFAPLMPLASESATNTVPVRRSDSSSDQSDASDSDSSLGFPTEIDEYFESFSPEMRLLTLHMLAEMVLADHDKLLSAGSLSDIAHANLRCDPLGTDAVGNIYWYFGDKERVYREPPANSFDSLVLPISRRPSNQRTVSRMPRRDFSRNSSGILLLDNGPGSLRSTPNSTECRPGMPNTRQLESNGVKNKQLVEDIFGSANTSQDSVEILTGIAATTDTTNREVVVQTSSTKKESTKHASGTDLERKISSRNQKKMSQHTREKMPTETSALKTPVTRRSSSRIRNQKKLQELELFSEPTKPPKRPRMIEPIFVDLALRKCDGWETLSIGTDALKEIVSRFENEKRDVSIPEQSLVRTLRDSVLPEIIVQETKIRREIEKKQKSEILLATQKRSTRLEAIALRRAEEAQKRAEDDERERQRLKHLKWHEETVVARLLNAEKEQSRDIHNFRQLRNVQCSSEGNDESQIKLEQEVMMKAEFPPQRQGLRIRRSLRLDKRHSFSSTSETTSKDNIDLRSSRTENPSRSGKKPFPSSHENFTEEHSTSRSTDRKSSSNRHDLEVEISPGDDCDDTTTNQNESKEESNNNKKGAPPLICSSLILENEVSEEFTWDSHRDDGMPVRVLDKFFLINPVSFSNVSLESCTEEEPKTVAIGILIPPTQSSPNVLRVQIGPVKEWTIEYGQEPKLWLKSKSGWYELRNPANEYATAFASGRRKFELCGRLGILGKTMRARQLGYEDVVELLEMTYQQMAGYDEAEIILEKRFIVEQMTMFGRKSILQSGFFKTLVSKIRAEDRKKSAATREINTIESKSTNSEGEVNFKKEGTRSVNKRTRRASQSSSPDGQESLTNGRKHIPRAVSSILSGLFQAATKSEESVRTRKLNGMVEQ